MTTPARNIPRRNNRLTRAIGRFILNMFGWSFQGELPDVPRQVVIVAPHTSNWDFIIGVLALFSLDLKANWIGKHSIFTPPFHLVMDWLGGIPVNRSLPNDLVNSTRKRFEREERMVLGLAPEGTRGRVEKWKRGFYRIAEGAGVPITCAGIDYRTRTIRFGPVIQPSGRYEDDIDIIREFYSGVTGRYPEKFSLPD